jgi:hypothetical protein
LIWITQDSFSSIIYTVRIVPMINKDLDIDFCWRLITSRSQKQNRRGQHKLAARPRSTAAHEHDSLNYRFGVLPESRNAEPGSSRRRDVCCID